MRAKGATFLMMGLLAVAAGAAQAMPLEIGGGWREFNWDNAPNAWNSEGAFTFDGASWTVLKVTDILIDGDQFEVYDWAAWIGTTSVPADDGAAIGADADIAFADPDWSSGAFLLAPGAHSITLKTIETATGWVGGTGCIRVDTTNAIPAPGALVLGSLGIGLVGWLRRRRTL